MKLDCQGSAARYERALQSIPSGVHSSTRARQPHPIYFTKGEGGEVWDVDGNRHIDLIMGNGAVMLGHGNRAVQESIEQALKSGLSCGIETDLALDVAEMLLEMIPSAELVRFTNTGTEAATHALHIARCQTQKARVAKIEGSYHGWTDELFVSCWPDMSKNGTLDEPTSLAGSMGLHPEMVRSTLVLPFNDIERTERLLKKHAHEVAAVILEPVLIDVGYIPASSEYLNMLRNLCSELNIVLIFDELLTGFREAPGGAQQKYGITPDLSLFGKAIANGFPMAVVTGTEAVMRLTEHGKGPVFVGTFNGHALPLAAAQATLPQLRDGSTQKTLNMHAESLRARFDETAQSLGVNAKLVGEGGHLHWYFTDNEITDYRSATTTNVQQYAAFNNVLASRGVLVMGNPLSHHAISLGHGDTIIEELQEIFADGLRAAAEVES